WATTTTVTELSGWIVRATLEQQPARASSTELSATSYTRWCNPRGPVEPMYIPGRLRTASNPSRTVMSLASYPDARGFGAAPLGRAREPREEPPAPRLPAPFWELSLRVANSPRITRDR